MLSFFQAYPLAAVNKIVIVDAGTKGVAFSYRACQDLPF